MRKVRAKHDPVLSLVIEHMYTELQYHGRVRIAATIKHLDLGVHRQFIRDNMPIVRAVLEEAFGPLTAFGVDETAAGRGRGNKTVGFVRTMAAFSDIVDDSLDLKRGIATGIAEAHNEVSNNIREADGVARPEVTVVAQLVAPEKKLQLARTALAGMKGEKK